MTKVDSDFETEKEYSAEAILAALKALLEVLPPESGNLANLKSSVLSRLRLQIESTIGRLQELEKDLDPIKPAKNILDPSDPSLVGKLIADTLLLQERHPLAEIPKFYGSGVYAIYYTGYFDAYVPIANTETPIYVGKADPAIPQASTAKEQGLRLSDRLNDHRKTIKASNLEIEDFEVRYLSVKSAWQGTAELYLIDRFRPVWNKETKVCFGFGKHGDKASTRSNRRSAWDTLHPGRKWATTADNVLNKSTIDEIKKRISDHFLKFPPIVEL